MNTAISDLFFNYDHPDYDALPEDASEEDADAALLKAAEEFAASCKSAFGVNIDTAALVEDFKGRV
jgi:hypothetical protein